MMNKSLYVIILNYNHLEDLQETINSFLLQDYPNLQIIISDNGSSDNSLQWVRKQHPNIKVLDNKKNLGWAAGNNVGIKYAIENNADYILLANNDLYFNDKSLLSKLIGDIGDDKKLIIGPKQYYYYEPDEVFTAGRYFMGVEKPVYNKLRAKTIKEKQYPENLKVVDYTPGSFVLFHSSLVHNIGYIDEDFFLYGEDADYFLRAWKKGYISLVDTNLSIWHKVSATSGNNSPLKAYYQNRNIWRNLDKHKDIIDSISFFKRQALKSFLKNIFRYLFKGNFKLFYSALKGFCHGYK
jgi:GT2 family glycosyltransferase